MTQNKVPDIKDLMLDPEQAFKNDELKTLLNHEPKKEWLKTNQFANNSLYLPIDKVEILLDSIFQKWRVEVLNTSSMFNAVTATVRLHYVDPVSGEWMYHDGVGAKALQVNKGFLPSDMAQIKDNAVMLALPIAKTQALKDAADHLGKLFGRDLNRKDTVEFRPLKSQTAIDAQNKMNEHLKKTEA